MRRDVAEVVLPAERPPGPRVEHLQRLRAGRRLREQVVRLHGDELAEQSLPRRGLREHERLRLREVLRRAALDRVARERERRSREADHGHVALLQLAPDDADRLERARHRLLRRRRAEHVDVAARRDRVADTRPVALHEVEVEAHPDERREDVREDDRRVEAERVDRQQGHLRRELRRADDLEHRVLLPDRAVRGLVAAGLPEEPDGRPLDRKTAAGAQEDRGRLDLRGARVRIGYGLLCHATRPTKNGPSRSRWSDVCFVLRMRWTMIDSGWSSGPSRPTTKSLSSRSRPWHASRMS